MRRVLLAGLFPAFAAAAPSEIKVFTDELAAYREHTLELHANRGGGTTRFMPEYSYGIWPGWEASLQLPLAWNEGLRGEGYRVELQYVAPHDAARGWYWGVNFELARVEQVGEQHFWSVELMPIVGWRDASWHLALNPGGTAAVSGTERKRSFDPAAKIAYAVAPRSAIGLEYYAEGEARSRSLYLAWDGKVGKSDVNVGLGRGLSPAADRWVMKTIVEIAF